MNFSDLEKNLAGSTGSNDDLFQAIVNAPFKYRVETALLFLGIIVLLLVNEKSGQIERVALSKTELADNTKKVSMLSFEEITIPLNNQENIIAKAINSGKPQDTTDWKYLFTPALTPEQARINQASGGIAYSAVYPFQARQGGALIFSYFQYLNQIGPLQTEFMEKYLAMVEKSLRASIE